MTKLFQPRPFYMPRNMDREKSLSAAEATTLLEQITRAMLDGGLSGKDMIFLNSVAEQVHPGFSVSSKQRYWLNNIFAQTGVHRDPRDLTALRQRR